jgi:hypothetical protein
MEKSEQEKAEEVLKKRERATKGFAETNDRGEDPLEGQDEESDRLARDALTLGIGMKRTG